MVGEVLPGRVRAPLLAHEQHRRVRGGEHQARPGLDQARVHGGGDPVPGGPVADLVVVLQVTQEPVRGHPEDVHLPAVGPAAEL